eukprot:3217990-Heterocapsa_arctica.AAC.1
MCQGGFAVQILNCSQVGLDLDTERAGKADNAAVGDDKGLQGPAASDHMQMARRFLKRKMASAGKGVRKVKRKKSWQ